MHAMHNHMKRGRMSNILILNQPYVNVGLDTMTYTIPAAGLYSLHFEVTEVPPSGLSVVVNQNGSPVYTSATPTPTQSAFQFKQGLVCALNDVITVVLSSSSAIDSALNNVKSIIAIEQGL
jgi:hypothetical protein